MVRILEAVDYEALFELKEKRNSGKNILAELSEELSRLRSRVKKKTALLVRANREHAVMEKKIKDGQNRIFYIRDQVSALDENAYLMKEELENKEKQLAELKRKRQQVIDNIINAQEEEREASKRVRTLEDDSRNLNERIDERRLVKQKETNAISVALDKTSFAKEEIEEKITKLNNAFIDSVGERTEVTTRLTEMTTAVEDLREENSHIEEKKEVLEQFQVLKEEHSSLELEVREANREAEVLDRRLEDLEKKLEPLQQQFDNMIETNKCRAEEMGALEEELAEYDKAATKHGAAREEKGQTLDVNKQGMKKLLNLFTETVRLENGLPNMEKKIEVIRGFLP